MTHQSRTPRRPLPVVVAVVQLQQLVMWVVWALLLAAFAVFAEDPMARRGREGLNKIQNLLHCADRADDPIQAFAWNRNALLLERRFFDTLLNDVASCGDSVQDPRLVRCGL